MDPKARFSAGGHSVSGVTAELLSVLADSEIWKLAGGGDISETKLVHAFDTAVPPEERIPLATSIVQAIRSRRSLARWIPWYPYLSAHEYANQFYPAYRDHSLHTLQVYLLGVYLYQTVHTLRGAIDAQLSRGDLPDATPGVPFLEWWTLAALWHDIGYPFESTEFISSAELRHSQLVARKRGIRSGDSLPGIVVRPANRARIPVVATDVAHQLLGQVRGRCEDASRDHVALDLGEPDLDLIEPGRIRRCEVQLQARRAFEEAADLCRLVRGEVVEDDVDLSPGRLSGQQLFEKGDQLVAGMALHGLAKDGSAQCVERGVERERAVAEVLEAVALQAPRRERQHRIEPVERLDVTLLVQAEHRSMLRRIEIETNDVGGLLLEIGIVGSHVALDPMRLESRSLPDLRHRHVGDAELGCQLARRPVRRSIGRRLAGQRQDASLHLRRDHPRGAPQVSRVQPRQSVSLKARLPSSHVRRRAADLLADLPVRTARCKHEDYPSATQILGATTTRTHPSFELLPFWRSDVHTSVSHAWNTITSDSGFMLTSH